MEMENFKQIMNMREQFAQNREKAKFNFCGYTFERRENIMDKNFGVKKSMLSEEDKYHQKRHERKLKEIKFRKI